MTDDGRSLFKSYYPRRPSRDYEYLFDGDLWSLTPGEDIGSVSAFRVRLSRLCQDRGLRHRTVVHNGVLWVEVFRQTPGDLLRETDPEAANVPPEPLPWR